MLWGVAFVVAFGLAPAAFAEAGGDVAMIVTGSRKANGEALVRIRVDLDSNAVYETLGTTSIPAPARGSRTVSASRRRVRRQLGEQLVTAAATDSGQDLRLTRTAPGQPRSSRARSSGPGRASSRRRPEQRRPRGADRGRGLGDAERQDLLGHRSGRPRARRPAGSFLAFPSGFRGGVRVAAGNTNTTPRRRGDRRLLRLRGPADQDLDRRPTSTDRLRRSLLEDVKVYSSSFRGGVNVAAGEIVTSAATARTYDRPAAGKGKVFIRTDTDADGLVSDDPAFESFFYPYGSGWNKGIASRPATPTTAASSSRS